jgi:hypothetical protein
VVGQQVVHRVLPTSRRVIVVILRTARRRFPMVCKLVLAVNSPSDPKSFTHKSIFHLFFCCLPFFILSSKNVCCEFFFCYAMGAFVEDVVVVACSCSRVFALVGVGIRWRSGMGSSVAARRVDIWNCSVYASFNNPDITWSCVYMSYS